MKKDVILEALKNAGVELEEDKAKEFVKAINIANDEDIQKVKSQITEIEEAKKKVEEELQTKTNELSNFNSEEIESLRKYKEENENKIKADKQSESLKGFLTANKYSSDDILMSYISSKLNPTFDDDNKITNGDELLAKLGESAGQYKITQTEGGAKPTLEVAKTNNLEEDLFIAGFNKER